MSLGLAFGTTRTTFAYLDCFDNENDSIPFLKNPFTPEVNLEQLKLWDGVSVHS
jgi:hypothetical protein